MKMFWVERNDFCVCGSRKKYKKCCLPRVEEAYQILSKAVGPELAAPGRQFLETLAFVCGLNLGEEMAVPEMERVGRLLREIWEAEVESEELRQARLKKLGEKLVSLLVEKATLRDIRLPLEIVYELEETVQSEAEAGEFVTAKSRQLAKDWSFVMTAVYNIMSSLRSEKYTDEELKILLAGLQWLADDDLRPLFIAVVGDATLSEIKEGLRKGELIFKEKGKYDKQAEREFLEYCGEHQAFGEYAYRRVLADAKPFLDAIDERKVKLVPPLYAIVQGYYTMIRAAIKVVADTAEGRFLEAAGFSYNWIWETLWENEEADYFIPAVIELLWEHADAASDEEIAKAAEVLVSAVSVSIYLSRTELLDDLYVAALQGFISSFPMTLAGTDVKIRGMEDTLDEKIMTSYAEQLREQGKHKEADYFWQQFQKLHPEASEVYARAWNLIEKLISEL